MQIPIEKIESNSIRLNIEIESLEDSLRREGQLSPIRVRPHPLQNGRYQVIFGNRRLEAARKLGWKTIDAIISDALDCQAMLMALSENIERDDFSDYEKGLLIENIHLSENKSYAEIAKLIGKSLAYVYQHTAMLRLFPEEIAPEAERRKVLSLLNEKQARVLLRIEDTSERWATAKLAITAKLCVRELENMLSGNNRMRNRRSANSKALISGIIKDIVCGMNCGDLRPHSETMSDQYSLFPSLPPYIKMDKDTAVQYMCGLLRSGRRFEMEDLEVKSFGKFAYAFLQIPWEISLLGKKVRARARGTLIFVKEGEWKLLHEHWSLANPLDVLEFILADNPAILGPEIKYEARSWK